jgi:phage protein U
MLMALGQFVWGINSLAYHQLQRQNNWRWAANNRVGQRPARQYVGPGDDIITLSGWVSPELCGDINAIETLRLMADQGDPYVLVDAIGTVYGLWVIDGLTETGTLHRVDSKPRRVDFSLTIARVDDDLIDQVGLITDTEALL